MNYDRPDILTEIENEYNAIQRRIRESQQYIDQSTHEVERWQQKSVASNSQLRRIHDNFDTVPRQDIKVAYEEALDAKQRLLTLRYQLEKLQDTKTQLEQYADLFGRLLGQLKGSDLLVVDTGGKMAETSGVTLSEAGETIVRIIEAQEEERQRLANSLHDGPAQSLTNFILQAEVCQRLFDRDPDRANNELQNLKAAASATFKKIREFIFDLRPMMLDDLGLVPTLRRYAESFQEKNEIKVTITVLGEDRRLAKPIEVMMFRCIQNIMGVSRDHLAAQEVSVVLDLGVDNVKATLEDNGQGFDPQADLDPNQGDKGVQSLNALRDRIELVNGEFDIYSAPGETSRFVVVLPIYQSARF